ncbi:cytochrome P450, partial [Nocardia gipuzkoensis]
GETVTIALPATNRDESVFAAPDTLEIGRSDARHHLAFGYGAHRCLGQYLAELELRIAYRRIFERLPGLRLAAEDVPMRGNATIYGPRSLMVTWDDRH